LDRYKRDRLFKICTGVGVCLLVSTSTSRKDELFWWLLLTLIALVLVNVFLDQEDNREERLVWWSMFWFVEAIITLGAVLIRISRG